MSDCKQCPEDNSGKEWYRFLCFTWDIRKARKFVEGKEAQGVVQVESLKKYGLPIDQPTEGVDEQGRRWFSVGMTYVNEEHLSHIPEEKLNEPILLAPLVTKGIRSLMIIDGAHRATKLAREGKTVRAFVLSDAESLACLNIGPADRKFFKVFPKVKAAVCA